MTAVGIKGLKLMDSSFHEISTHLATAHTLDSADALTHLLHYTTSFICVGVPSKFSHLPRRLSRLHRDLWRNPEGRSADEGRVVIDRHLPL